MQIYFNKTKSRFSYETCLVENYTPYNTTLQYKFIKEGLRRILRICVKINVFVSIFWKNWQLKCFYNWLIREWLNEDSLGQVVSVMAFDPSVTLSHQLLMWRRRQAGPPNTDPWKRVCLPGESSEPRQHRPERRGALAVQWARCQTHETTRWCTKPVALFQSATSSKSPRNRSG